MARTPYVTVRGSEPVPPPSQPKETTMPAEYERRDLNPDTQEKPEDRPPEAEAEEPKPVKLDAEEVNELLDIVHNTADLPSLLALNQAAMINLTIMAKEVQEELTKRAEEAQKKAEELQAKIVAWKQKKEDERKAKEKADAA